jgi:hypothetical protein
MAQTSYGSIIGEKKEAFLTEAQFQAIYGTNWVLADGRDVTGSAFAILFGSTTLPDMRATVSRMKDNAAGKDSYGDMPLGTYEADQFASHYHPLFTTQFRDVAGGAGGSSAGVNTSPGYNTTDYAGAGETNAKSTVINFFIRIN